MRLIDADVANVDEISCYYGESVRLDDVEEWLNDQPVVDPVKHGRWIPAPVDSGLTKGHLVCSVCGKVKPCWISCGILQFWICDYCPNCGAKMDADETKQ